MFAECVWFSSDLSAGAGLPLWRWLSVWGRSVWAGEIRSSAEGFWCQLIVTHDFSVMVCLCSWRVFVSRVQRRFVPRLRLKCVWSSRWIGPWKPACCSRLLSRSPGLNIWGRRRRRRAWALTAGPSSPAYLLTYRYTHNHSLWWFLGNFTNYY